MSILSVLTQILFVGHSLVGPDLPPLVEAGLLAMDKPAVVQMQVINGAPLVWNWDHSAEGEGVDGRAVLAGGTISDLILTEAQPIAEHVSWNDSAGLVARWADAAGPDASVWLYETWPAFGPEGVAAWRAQLAADLPLWQAAAGDRATIIPAGQAMGLLADRIAADAVPGLAAITDLFSDEIHLNGKGHYFVAMVHLAALTGETPEGLPERLLRFWPSRDAILTAEQALVLQQVAWQAVQDFGAVPQAAAVPAAETVVPAPAEPSLPAAAPPGPYLQTPMPDFAPITNPNLALGLAGVHDWSVQQPFLDVMKTARPWIAHLPGQWGGWDEAALRAAGALDADGWPLRIPPEVTGITTLILTDLPYGTGGVAGRYVLTHQGKGVLKVEGRVTVVDASAGQVVFDYAPGDGSVILTIAETDPVDPIRRIAVVRQDRLADWQAGQLFNPDWLTRISGARMLRFMDWMATNNSTLATVADRPRPGDYSWARQGVPVEVIVQLANRLQADPWLTIPHLAEDALVAEMANVVAAGLDPGLRVWVEFSNEVWNWQFTQAAWADAQAKAHWGVESAWVSFYALRASEVMALWSDRIAPQRLVRVIATQTGWQGLEQAILSPSLITDEGQPPPYQGFDAYAVTGYVSGQIGTDEKAAALRGWIAESTAVAEAEAAAQGMDGPKAGDYVRAHRFALAIDRAAQDIRDGSLTGSATDTLAQMRDEVFPYHAAVARAHGLRLVMYEGGTHVVGQGALIDDPDLTAFFAALNYAPQMGAIYRDLLAAWATQTDAPFNAFVDVYAPGKWGSWGALRHLWDDNPRWQALIAAPGGAAP